MNGNPKEITLAKLDVLVMPNGEILCDGMTIGQVDEVGKYLSDLKDAITGKPVGTTDGVDYTVKPIQ